MKNKKAQLEINHKILVEVMAAVFFALILFLTIKAIAGVLPGKHQADCTNDKWWDDPRGLKEILKEVDKGKYKEFMFYNENCNLVSFSFRQETPIQHPDAPTLEPRLCLCNLDGDLCDPYDCYKFKNYKQINTQQFSTEPLEKYVFLKFIKQDEETLIIDFTSAKKQPEPIKLEEPSLQISPEAAKLINSMTVLFNTREIKDFRPIVKNVQQTEDVAPVGIDNIKGFTFLFDLDLANPPVYGQSDEDYLRNYLPIDQNAVKQALIEFKIDKTKYSALDSVQKEKVALYFKKDDKYESVLMKCQEVTSEIMCKAFLNDFSSNFAVSVDLPELVQEQPIGATSTQ